jgi:hypothetical protein
VVLALVAAAPVAAVQPTRTVFVRGPVAHFDAGDSGCDFAVTIYRSPGSTVTITDFSDGREVVKQHQMHATIVNDATGTTLVNNYEFRDVEWIDPTDGLIHGATSGQFADTFYPGDIGPFGVVDHLVSYFVTGQQAYVVDPNTFATLALTINGTITDACAALS